MLHLGSGPAMMVSVIGVQEDMRISEGKFRAAKAVEWGQLEQAATLNRLRGRRVQDLPIAVPASSELVDEYAQPQSQ